MKLEKNFVTRMIKIAFYDTDRNSNNRKGSWKEA
jgi:hypothetical protein